MKPIEEVHLERVGGKWILKVIRSDGLVVTTAHDNFLTALLHLESLPDTEVVAPMTEAEQIEEVRRGRT